MAREMKKYDNKLEQWKQILSNVDKLASIAVTRKGKYTPADLKSLIKLRMEYEASPLRIAEDRTYFELIVKYAKEVREISRKSFSFSDTLGALSEAINEVRVSLKLPSELKQLYDVFVSDQELQDPDSKAKASDVITTIEELISHWHWQAEEYSGINVQVEIFQNDNHDNPEKEAEIRTVKQNSALIKHYWFSSVCCFRDSGVIRDFADLEDSRPVLVFGPSQESCIKLIESVYDNNRYNTFRWPSHLNSPYSPVSYYQYGAMFAVDAGNWDPTQYKSFLRHCNLICNSKWNKKKVKMTDISIFIDESEILASQALMDEITTISNQHRVTIIRSSKQIDNEKAKRVAATGQDLLEQLKSWPYITDILANPHNQSNIIDVYKDLPVNTHPAVQCFVILEKSARCVKKCVKKDTPLSKVVGDTPFSKVVGNRMELLLCCNSILPIEVFFRLYLYCLGTAQHPFHESNGAEYPFILSLNGGFEAVVKMERLWSGDDIFSKSLAM